MKKDFNNLIVLSEVDSTNNYANHLISAESVSSGTVVLAQYQKSGRGQRGNAWKSAPGKNLLASIVLYPDFLPAPQQFYLSKIASLALAGWLDGKADEVSVKWPNDVFAGNKKIAGILIETSVKGNLLYSAVVGLGLNLNQEAFDPSVPHAVSLKILSGTHWDINTAAIEIRNILLGWYVKLHAGAVEEIDKAYFDRLFRNNQWALYREGNNTREARIIDVKPDGQLIVEDRSGSITGYYFKEIEFVI